MNKYERAYGTDWDTLDKDAVIDRAYALGVAASLGEYHPDELDRIREEVDTSYDKSVVDLAFDEGKNEARELDVDPNISAGEPVWAELVGGKAVTVDEEDVPTGGRDGLPDALDRPEPGKNEAVDRPDFLEKD